MAATAAAATAAACYIRMQSSGGIPPEKQEQRIALPIEIGPTNRGREERRKERKLRSVIELTSSPAREIPGHYQQTRKLEIISKT